MMLGGVETEINLGTDTFEVSWLLRDKRHDLVNWLYVSKSNPPPGTKKSYSGGSVISKIEVLTSFKIT